MARIKDESEKNVKPHGKGREFMEMISHVPAYLFCRMVTRSGIPAQEARELINEFRSLKG